jgi:AraC family L-rhamnose operon regulatory protein RhaS
MKKLETLSLKENEITDAGVEHLAKVAQRCGLGTTQFVRYSRQLTNLTPMQYLNTCRLETAARMLVDLPERSVIDVALDCGFSSSQYFATVFRRQFGCTPRAFRRKGT